MQKSKFSKAHLILQGLVLSTTVVGGIATLGSTAIVQAEEVSQQVVITIKYVDASGNQVAPSQEIVGVSGQAYNIKRDPIDGYNYVSVNGAESGVFTTNMTVTYTLAKGGSGLTSNGVVNIKYVTADGDTLGESSVDGYVGSTFKIPVRAFAGYKLQNGQGAVDGRFTNDPQTVTFVYEKTQQTAKQAAKSADSTKQNADTQAIQNQNPVPNGNVTTNSDTGTVTSGSSTVIAPVTIGTNSSTGTSTSSTGTTSTTGTTTSSTGTTSTSTKTQENSPNTSAAASGSVLGLGVALSSLGGVGVFIKRFIG